MGLIIKDKIEMFKKGYPTVSDKYNVAGGTLDASSDPVEFGDLVAFADTKGYFVKAKGLTTADEIAGFAVATNVKLATEWPGTTVKTLPGEEVNLLVNGFIAVELNTDAKEAKVLPNKPVYVTADGKCTTEENDGASGSPKNYIKLPNTVFTGMVEKHGTLLYAEIYIK